MKVKPKNWGTIIVVIIVAVAAALLARSMGFASSKSGTRIGYFSNEGWDIWSANYLLLDGTMEKIVHSEDGELSVSVTTESGNISMVILDSDHHVIFEQNAIPTGSFVVSADQTVTIQIFAERHKGSFEIKG